MITETSPYTTQSSPSFTVDSFNLKAENMCHIIDIVENKLYSNKSLAVIREYACNAVDANIMSGNGHLPIKITLPSRFEPKFIVRDYGYGLNHDEMVNVFCSYGESTKRKTNNAIGQLGIGSKSAFSYGSSFTVVSYQNGYKTIYNCMKDSPRNKLVNLGKFDTDEMDGLEIIVNVKDNDINKFRSECFDFFKYWDKKPVIEGFTSEEIENLNKPTDIVLQGTGWKIVTPKSQDGYRGRTESPIALMGNIPYPIVWDNVNGFDEFMSARGGYEFSNFIKGNSFIFNFAIGDVQMSPSRESLEYVDKTNNAILSRLKVCLSEIAATAQAKMDKVSNLWEASCLYTELFGDYSSVMYNLKNAVKLTFNNKIVSSGNISMGSHSAVWNLHTQRRSQGKFTSYNASYHHNSAFLECNKGSIILWMDMDASITPKLHTQRVFEYIKANKGINRIYVLDFNNYEFDKAVVYADLGLDDSFIGRYSDYYKIVVDAIAADKAAAKLARQGLPVAPRKPMTTLKVVKVLEHTGFRVDSSRELNSKEIDISLGGIYVETFANETSEDAKYDLYQCTLALKMFKMKGISPTVYVMGQDVTDTRVFKAANWVKFSDYIDETVKNLVVNDSELRKQMIVDSQVKTLDIHRLGAIFLSDNAITDELTMIAKWILSSYNNGSWSWVKYEFDATEVAEVLEVVANIKKKYPLFDIVMDWISRNSYDYREKTAELVKYFQNPLDINV